jgi:hypothetical protein
LELEADFWLTNKLSDKAAVSLLDLETEQWILERVDVSGDRA